MQQSTTQTQNRKSHNRNQTRRFEPHVPDELSSAEQRRWREQREMLRRIPIEDIHRPFIGVGVRANFRRRFVDQVLFLFLQDIPVGHWAGKTRETLWCNVLRPSLTKEGLKVKPSDRRPPFDFRTLPFHRGFRWETWNADRRGNHITTPLDGKLVKVNTDTMRYIAVEREDGVHPIIRIPLSQCQNLPTMPELVHEGDRVHAGQGILHISESMTPDVAYYSGEAPATVLNSFKDVELFRAFLEMDSLMTEYAAHHKSTWSRVFRPDANAPELPIYPAGHGLPVPYVVVRDTEPLVEQFAAHKFPFTREFKADMLDWIAEGMPIVAEFSGNYVGGSPSEREGYMHLDFQVVGENDKDEIIAQRQFQQVPVAAALNLPLELNEPVIEGETIVAYGCVPTRLADWSEVSPFLGRIDRCEMFRFLRMSRIRADKTRQPDNWTGPGDLYPLKYMYASPPASSNKKGDKKAEPLRPRRLVWDLVPTREWYDAESETALLPPLQVSEEWNVEQMAFRLGLIEFDLTPRNMRFSPTPLAPPAVHRS